MWEVPFALDRREMIIEKQATPLKHSIAVTLTSTDSVPLNQTFIMMDTQDMPRASGRSM